MAEVVVFHHAHGLTQGVAAFAETLREAGHVVHVPDLYEGNVFDDLDDGVGYADAAGFGTIVDRGVAAAEAMADDLVYVGFSLGVMPAQKLAQTRAGARGAVLMGSFVPHDHFADTWPAGVPAQIHAMDADPFFVGEGDIDAARAATAASADLEMFLYPGDGHLFADASLAAHDPAAASLFEARVLALLATIDEDAAHG